MVNNLVTIDTKVRSKGAIVSFGLLSSVLVAICAISSGSLWMDEFGTWFLTRANSIPEWWSRFQAWPDSDSQIPIYHFYMYIWTKLFGTDALAMRASNAGLFVIANLALLWPFRSQSTIAFPLIIASCLSAPIWYYLNELRPYIMLYMGASLMLGATIEMMRSQQSPNSFEMKVLCVGAVISTGATTIGIVWAGSIMLFALIYWLAIRKGDLFEDLVHDNYFTLAIAALSITALIAHDIRMFAHGNLPEVLHESNIFTLLFSFYTNAGLLGVGPGMLDLRANGIAALVPFAPVTAFSAILFSMLAIAGLVEVRTLLGTRTVAISIGCALLPVLVIFALGLVLHWRVLPRHFIPLVSLFSLLYAYGIAWWWRRRFTGVLVTVISVLTMAYSSLGVRLAARHAKDDYKHAAQLATIELAQNGRVWWVADFRGALFYGVPYVSDELAWSHPKYDRGVKFFMGDKTFSYLSAQEPPTLVLVSKSDAYDKHNVVSKYLSANAYHLAETFPAFTAWSR
jgi:hypothetical protein